jgi:hypothetical protein
MSRYNCRNRYGNDWEQYHRHRQRDRAVFGIVLVIIGILLLLKTLGFIWFSFVFTWPLILILIGALIAIKSGFRNPAWWILMIIGIANMTPEFTINGVASRHLIWPIVLIIGGLAVAFRPRKKYYPVTPTFGKTQSSTTDENTLNIDVTFGGRKEFVTSKDFKGGMVSTTFGGCEINLMQADTTEKTIVLELKIAFGGLELIVPSHWEIQNEINPSFSNVEDERSIQTPASPEQKKTLILRGSCSFGSVEIKSY